jgi:uncharacterized membrane protein YfcA
MNRSTLEVFDMTYAMLCLFGVGVGVLSGMFGIGGGVALVPGLILLFGFSQAEAQGTSLAVLILPVAAFAVIVYYQRGFVRLPVVGWIALGFAAGAFLGAVLVNQLSVEWLPWLRIAFGIMLLYVGFVFVLTPASQRSAAALPAGLATVIAGFLSWLVRRKMLPAPARPAPPADDLDYHL